MVAKPVLWFPKSARHPTTTWFELTIVNLLASAVHLPQRKPECKQGVAKIFAALSPQRPLCIEGHLPGSAEAPARLSEQDLWSTGSDPRLLLVSAFTAIPSRVKQKQSHRRVFPLLSFVCLIIQHGMATQPFGYMPEIGKFCAAWMKTWAPTKECEGIAN